MRSGGLTTSQSRYGSARSAVEFILNPNDPLVIDAFVRALESHVGIALTPDKRYLLQSRLTPLARSNSLENWPDLLQLLYGRPVGPLHWQAFEALITHETSFFRDPFHFEQLRLKVFPELIARRRSTRRLRLWCAGVSTGQEAYSLAMLLRENFPELLDWDVRILGTDIAASVLARARQGLFSAAEVSRGLSSARLAATFTATKNNHYSINSASLPPLSFETLNLIADWPDLGHFDLVLMRNVLIYFKAERRAQILSKIHARLAEDGGYLMLGASESILNDKLFRTLVLPRGVLFTNLLA